MYADENENDGTYGVTLDIIYPFTTFHCSKLVRCLTSIKTGPDDPQDIQGTISWAAHVPRFDRNLKSSGGIFQVWIR